MLAVSDSNGPGTTRFSQAAGTADVSASNFSTRYCALHPTAHINMYRQTVACPRAAQKNGDVPKSPFPTVAAVVPSAGTILKIDLCSFTRMRSTLAFCRRARCLRRAFPRLVMVLF
jgi:hypothetical protein